MATSYKGNLFTLLFTGFVNPSYLGPNDADDPTGANGFDISKAKALVISFPGSGYTATVAHEQTLDPTGLTGWFPIVGKTVNASANALTASASVASQAFIFPSMGVRHRIRVTALTVADLLARIALLSDTMDLSTAAGLQVSGGVAEDGAAGSSGPVMIGLEARNVQKTNMSASGDVVRAQSTMDGRQVTINDSIPELSWQFAGIAGGIVSSTADTVLIAAGGATVRRYLNSLHIGHDVLGAVTEYVIKDGATVIHRGKLQTPANEGDLITFPKPLRSSLNAALNFALLTSTTGGVFINATGHSGN